VVFGRGRDDDDDDDDEDYEEEEMEYILFKGAQNGNNPDLSEHGRLMQAALEPAKRLISDALERRAEMIRLEPKGKAAAATYFVDGIPSAGDRLPVKLGAAITQMLKLLAGLNPKERSKPQSGTINAEYEEEDFEVRIDSQPIKGGAERLTIRVQNIENRLESARELGISESLIEKISAYGESKSGLMLAVGPPLSGVTTASIAMLRSIDAYIYSLYCIVDMQGRELPHVNMFESKEGDSLADTLARCERADAQVVLIDPIKDADSAQKSLAASAKLSLISEMPAKDAADGIMRLTKLSGDPKTVADALRLVMSQKLVRLLCTKCRQAYRPNPRLLKKVNLPPETKVLYRPPIYDEDVEDEEEPDYCEHCLGSGYYGRIGLLEVIEVTDGIKQIIIAGADPKQLRMQARKEKMQSFQTDGIRVVAEGKTSLEELQRVFRS